MAHPAVRCPGASLRAALLIAARHLLQIIQVPGEGVLRPMSRFRRDRKLERPPVADEWRDDLVAVEPHAVDARIGNLEALAAEPRHPRSRHAEPDDLRGDGLQRLIGASSNAAAIRSR